MLDQRRTKYIFAFLLIFLASCSGPAAPTEIPTSSPVPATPTTSLNGPSTLVPTPILEDWLNVSAMPIPRFEANAVALDGKIYVSGGITARHSLKSFVRFDPVTNAWDELAPMPDFRNHHGMAVLDGKIYVTGGNYGELSFDGQAKTFWVYTPEVDQWEALADMPIGRSSHGMAELNGKLYVAGGMLPRAGDATELWAFDPESNTWDASLAHLPTQRDHVIVTSYDGKLYVIGGRYSTNLPTVEIYDPVTDTWSQGPNMPTPRSGMAFAIIKDQLHTIAGEDIDRYLVYMKHEVFDFSSETWTQLHDIPRPLNAPVAVAVDGYIYVMGGGSISGNPYKDVWQFTP
jgi:N-acetylneuraminic acid mutarotase